MNYRSVLGRCVPVPFGVALFDGLAPDGSLYVPESLPVLPPGALAPAAGEGLPELATRVLAPFMTEFAPAELAAITARALAFPVPLVPLHGRIQLLELFHGPTLAFKDVGARFLAGTMSQLLERDGRTVTVLVATSGDTGSAVAQGFAGAARVAVLVLYPSGRVSDFQEAQITTVGGNVHALEVEGSFDDCQRLVKQALAEGARDPRRALTTANSINLGRLLPQVTYALWAGAQLRARLGGAAAPTVVVPSGNFGNLTATCYARALGMPVRRLVAATNANDVVPEYLRTGRYHPRPSVATHSSAMDVGDPSNLPRIEHLFGHDGAALRAALRGEAVTDTDTLDEIRRTHAETGVVLDPHTAVGVAAARRLDGDEPVVVMATAHPAKFPAVIRAALGRAVEPPPALAAALDRPRRSTRIAADPAALRAWIARVGALALAALGAVSPGPPARAQSSAVARDTLVSVAPARVDETDAGPFFYQGLRYGSESLVHPLRLVLNGGFGILQFDNRDNRIANVDFVGGWDRVRSDLLHPGVAIGVGGWADFLQREVLPFSVNRKAAQYWPNYTLHLVGGGMSYRLMREWYEQNGYGRSRWWAGSTMAVYHLLNEVVENDARPGPTTDAVADVFIFDPVGILLFDRDDVSRFFGRRLHLRDWSNQPALDPHRGTIENQGQNYAIKVPLPRTERWSALYYFGNHGELGLTYTRPDGNAFSVAAGLRAGKLVELGDGVQTAELVPTYGFFYDRDGSLLLSVTSANSSRYRVRVNLYPGLVHVRGRTAGVFLMVDRDGGVVTGIHLPWAPLGLAGRP